MLPMLCDDPEDTHKLGRYLIYCCWYCNTITFF